MTTTKPRGELEVFRVTDGLISWKYGNRSLIDKHFYTNALSRIEKLEAENAKLKEALENSMQALVSARDNIQHYFDEGCLPTLSELAEVSIAAEAANKALRECEGSNGL
jgi:hypothetical protein